MADIDGDFKLGLRPSPFLSAMEIPHLDQYFGVWSVLEEHFRAMVDRVSQIDIALHVAQMRAQDSASTSRARYQITESGIAVIPITGTMTKYGSSLSSAGSTVAIRRAVLNAMRDDKVKAIALLIDSPGGTVAGTRDLAAQVAEASKQKPTVAYIEDLGASAAYWVASQAREIYANPTAMVGSIGTFAVIQDASGAAAQLGIKVHVIRAGEFKGAGTAGTEITREQLDQWQQIVDDLNEHFIRGVSDGRRLTLLRTRQLADGRAHIAATASHLGLIDGVKSFDETLNQLLPIRRSKSMAETTTENPVTVTVPKPAAATLQQIEAACPGADNDFLCGQLRNAATEEQARNAWMAEQQKRIEAAKVEAISAQTKIAEAEAKAKAAETEAMIAKAKMPIPGVAPLGNSGTGKQSASDGDPVAAWNELIDGYAASLGNRGKAISKAVREHPEAHRAYLVAYNGQHNRPCNLHE